MRLERNGDVAAVADRQPVIVTKPELDALVEVLKAEGFAVMAPTVVGDAISVSRIERLDDLPIGWSDEQDGGRYRLRPSGSGEVFAFASPAQGWKRVLYPPNERLWTARSDGAGSLTAGSLTMEAAASDPQPYALFGVRACDLAALAVLDRVLDEGGAGDRLYLERRRRAFVVAVDCTRPGGTCFCASMATGPGVSDQAGHDIALTELSGDGRHEFVVRATTERGEQVLRQLGGRAAEEADLAAAEHAVAESASRMGREMVADAPSLLRRSLEHRRWRETAERCLTCGNCTAVCPTCFCVNMEERASLDGRSAERWRTWDSCFTIEFSYLHGGSIRRDASARYRQWITHKLAFWHEQFGMSGCVGCGRCITWCPVGIDITEEARALRDSEGGE